MVGEVEGDAVSRRKTRRVLVTSRKAHKRGRKLRVCGLTKNIEERENDEVNTVQLVFLLIGLFFLRFLVWIYEF